MEINGHNLSQEEVREMLEALELHLMDQFNAQKEEVAHLTFQDAKTMFESGSSYPQMYWELADKLKKAHLQKAGKPVLA